MLTSRFRSECSSSTELSGGGGGSMGWYELSRVDIGGLAIVME